jgi:hypothetical protein
MMKEMLPCSPMIRVAAHMMSSPKFLLRMYPRGGVSVFLAAVYLGSLPGLHEVKVFYKADLLVLHMGGHYGWSLSYRCLLNWLMSVLAFFSGLDAWLSA